MQYDTIPVSMKSLYRLIQKLIITLDIKIPDTL